MFIEVCLISLGLFTGSELYKKINKSSDGKQHNCGLRRKQQQPVRSAEGRSAQNSAKISSALESLTQEVSRLREDFSEYISVDKEVPEKFTEPPNITAQNVQQEAVSRPSIFEKLIEENVHLRQGETGE